MQNAEDCAGCHLCRCHWLFFVWAYGTQWAQQRTHLEFVFCIQQLSLLHLTAHTAPRCKLPATKFAVESWVQSQCLIRKERNRAQSHRQYHSVPQTNGGQRLSQWGFAWKAIKYCADGGFYNTRAGAAETGSSVVFCTPSLHLTCNRRGERQLSSIHLRRDGLVPIWTSLIVASRKTAWTIISQSWENKMHLFSGTWIVLQVFSRNDVLVEEVPRIEEHVSFQQPRPISLSPWLLPYP